MATFVRAGEGAGDDDGGGGGGVKRLLKLEGTLEEAFLVGDGGTLAGNNDGCLVGETAVCSAM